MSFKALWGVICIAAMLSPIISSAADPVPPPSPDPMAQAFQAIQQARERSERLGGVLEVMTTPEVYGFYTRRNDLYKHNLMKALGAYNALNSLRPIEDARNNDLVVIMNRFRTETDPAARAALIARLPNSAPFDTVGAELAIRKRIGELGAEAGKLKDEEEKYQEEKGRIESELKVAKRRISRNAEEARAREGEIQEILEEKWVILEKIETIHRRLVELAIEGNLLRDYMLAKNKDAKIAGIARGLGNDLRLFVGEVKDGKPVGGMRELWADIQANIAENRQMPAMSFDPGQGMFLRPIEPGDIVNPLRSNLADTPSPLRPLPDPESALGFMRPIPDTYRAPTPNPESLLAPAYPVVRPPAPTPRPTPRISPPRPRPRLPK